MSDHVPFEVLRALRAEDVTGALEHAVAGEQAANLGRLGGRVAAALTRLQAAAPDEREALEYACADVVWQYFVQREACGLRVHDAIVDAYAIPRAVLAKVGAAPPPPDEHR